MAYTSIPSESRSQIKRAGKILTRSAPNSPEYLEALELANRWRASHAYPINTFQATLRTNLVSYKNNPIVAQRLKRMQTVIDKLTRFENMQLTTMQDLGGVRAIVDDIDDVTRIVDKYTNNKGRLTHKLISQKDYILKPKDDTGYRGVHLVYEYQNKIKKDWNGLLIEIQIRTKLQHIWATAVETMGIFLNQALKSSQGDTVWLDFFALVSAAFSYREGTPRINRFAHLSEQEVYQEIYNTEKSLNILDRIGKFSEAVKFIGNNKNKKHSYHLIVLNLDDNSITITPYNRDSYVDATTDYADVEYRVSVGAERLEPVLVSAGPIDTLRKAYPNLFLDLSEFEDNLSSIIARVVFSSS